VEGYFKLYKIRGSIFLKGKLQWKEGKWRVIVSVTTNVDTLGKALNLCNMMSTNIFGKGALITQNLKRETIGSIAWIPRELRRYKEG
jgi:hypothetical protein